MAANQRSSATEQRNPTRRAVQLCADWLSMCLRIGWKRTDLDALQAIWWRYHDDEGNLT